MMLKKISKSSFVRSSLIFSASSFLVSVIGYAINLLIARSFSLADYGEYMAAMSYIVFLAVPTVTFGMMVVQRIGKEDISKREKVALDLEKWLFRETKRHFSIIIILAILFSFFIYFKGNLGLPAITFIVVSSLLNVFQSLYSSSLQAFKNFLWAGLLSIIVFFGKLVFSIGIISISPNLINLFLAFTFSSLVGLSVGRKMMGKISFSSDKNITNNFLNIFSYFKRKVLLVTLLATLGLIGLANIDIILVKKFFSSDQAGLYSSISLMGKIILYVSAPLSQVAFSFFAGKDSKHNSLRILILLSIIYTFIGGVATFIYFFFPDLVISIIFGSKFLSIGSLIWLAAVFGTLYSLITLFTQFYISKKDWWGSLTLGALALQFVLIFINHSSLFEVMKINIFVAFGLLLLFIGKIIFDNSKKL